MTVSPVNDPPVVQNYTFFVNLGVEKTGPSIHLQGSDPDGVPVAYYQLWDADPGWKLSDITFIELPVLEGYESQVEGRPRGGGEITFYVPSSSNPPTEERFAYRAFDEFNTMSNIGYVTVTVRNPKQSSDPPVAMDETIVTFEGEPFRGILNFTHPLGRYGVSPTFGITEGGCPSLGALWIDDAGAGEFTYRAHPLIASNAGNTVDQFGFQVRLANCPSCVDGGTMTAQVASKAHAPQLMCEGAASLISGSVGGAGIPESIPALLLCEDAVTASISYATRVWGARAAAFLLDTSSEGQAAEAGGNGRAIDAATLDALLLSGAFPSHG